MSEKTGQKYSALSKITPFMELQKGPLVPTNIYLLKVNNTKTRKSFEIRSKLVLQIKFRPDVFIFCLEHLSHLFLVFLFLTFNR